MFGTYNSGQPRVRILREGVRQKGVELIDCHVDLWATLEDRNRVDIWEKLKSKKSIIVFCRKVDLILRWITCYPGLLFRYLRLPPHDLVLISYPGLFDVLLIRFFASLRRVPVVWDMFISIYDTIVHDRAVIKPRHALAKLFWGLEWLAVRFADFIFMDTRSHAKRITSLYKLSKNKCGVVPVGVEVDKFKPSENGTRNPGPFRVLFYGQFIPLHGIEYIVEAAGLTEKEDIEWFLIGKGQEAPRIQEMLFREPLSNLRWVEWVDYAELKTWIESADICLGIFGTSEKAANVIPNKVYQIISVKKPLITRDSPAIRELLNDSPPCTYLVPAGNAKALADAVRKHKYLMGNCDRIDCHDFLAQRINASAIGGQFLEFIIQKIGIDSNDEHVR